MSENYNGYTLNDTGDANWGPTETQALKDIIGKLPNLTDTLVGAQHVHAGLVNSSNTITAVSCGSSNVAINASVVGIAALNPADPAPTIQTADGAQTARTQIVDTGFVGDTLVTGIGNFSTVSTSASPVADSMMVFAAGGMEIVADSGFLALFTDGNNGGSGDIYIQDSRLQQISFTSNGISIMPQYSAQAAVTFATDGSQPLVGFFGATPVAQQPTPAATFADIVALLQAYGLCP